MRESIRIPEGANMERITEDLRCLAVPIRLLTEHPDNPRVHGDANRKAIRGSLNRYQQRKPVVANKTEGGLLRLEAGHGVYQQMVVLGAEYIACTIVEDDPVSELGYMLADNRSGDLSEDDPEKLKAAIERILAHGEDVEIVGWDDDEIRKMVGEEDDGDPPTDDPAPIDKAAELQKVWQTARGQVWEIPSKSVPGKCHRVMCGDSTIANNYTAVCGDEKPWMMVTDPPYGVNYDPNWRVRDGTLSNTDGGTAQGIVSNDDNADWTITYKLFTGDVAYVWHADLKSPVVFANLQECTFIPRALIVWVKPGTPIGRGDYHHRHEPCWYSVRKGKSGARTDDRTQTTVWEIQQVRSGSESGDNTATGHSTQKPMECMARAIRNHAFPPGGCVYDPFLGSGTTLIAAEREGKICVGIELEPRYLAVILERAKNAGLEPRLTGV